jgi:hypothetical protein
MCIYQKPEEFALVIRPYSSFLLFITRLLRSYGSCREAVSDRVRTTTVNN